MAQKSSDTLPTHIEYHSADLYYTYTMYNPADVRWDVLNDIMSSYYLHIQRIFGLNDVKNSYYLAKFKWRKFKNTIPTVKLPMLYIRYGNYVHIISFGDSIDSIEDPSRNVLAYTSSITSPMIVIISTLLFH